MQTCECVLRSGGYCDPCCKVCCGQGQVDGSAAQGAVWALVFTVALGAAGFVLYQLIKRL